MARQLTGPRGERLLVHSDEQAAAWAARGYVGSGTTADDYDAMTVDALKDEIRKRNDDGRDDDGRLALTGTKAELVASLESDDK